VEATTSPYDFVKGVDECNFLELTKRLGDGLQTVLIFTNVLIIQNIPSSLNF